MRTLPNTPSSRSAGPISLRRLATLAAALLATITLSACGSLWPTEVPYNPGVGTNDRTGDVNVLNAVIVSATPGQGSFVATLVNRNEQAADQLLSVEAAGLTMGGGATPEIAAGGVVNLASAFNGIPVTGDAKLLKAGTFVRVRLNFKNADQVTVNVPVVTNAGPYSELIPSPSPSA